MKSSSPVTAIIINFFSSSLIARAVRSLLESPEAEMVDIHVVDNSADSHEQNELQRVLPRGVNLVINKDNKGFARACNQVFDTSESKYILLLNPDAYLSEKALPLLYDSLEKQPDLGAVSPQAFWDEQMRFYIPPAHDPLLFFIQPELSRLGLDSAAYRLVRKWWRNYSITVWKSSRLCEVRNICGGHVLLRRDAVDKAGGLFDPDFFVYFEDTDLSLRLKKAGYRCAIHPRARAVHSYNQCDIGNFARKGLLMAKSQKVFLEKHDNLKTRIFKKNLDRLKYFRFRNAQQTEPRHISSPLKLSPPPEFDPWLFEWSPNRDFIPSVGCFGQGRDFWMPVNCVDNLAPGRYYFRFGSSEGKGKTGPVYCWTRQEEI